MFNWLKRDPIRPEMVEALRGYLGEWGIGYFSKIYEKHGRLMIIEDHGIHPHCVHFREGMKVRNFLRSTGLCEDWDAHDYDNRWEEITIRACGYKR